jgi:hypothetical protein
MKKIPDTYQTSIYSEGVNFRCASNVPSGSSRENDSFESLILHRETILKNMRTIFETGNQLLSELDREINKLLIDISKDS